MAQELSRKEKTKQDKMASLISVGLLGLSIVIGAVFFVNNTNKNHRLETLLENVQEGYVVLPSGASHPKNESLVAHVIKEIESDKNTKKQKKELIELMAIQGIDTTEMVEAYNSVYNTGLKASNTDKDEDKAEAEVSTEKVDNDGDGINDLFEIKNETPVLNFLRTEGIVTDDTLETVDRGESGINMIGGKSAKSYRNLYEAEKAFGTRLGMFFYSTTLVNHEMVAAYTVGDEFLQCVYAVNRDGSPIIEGQDIEESDINTLTVKLSMTKETDELRKVYKDYELQFEQEISTVEPTDTYFYGASEDQIHMICLDMDNGRSYVIHSANGIDAVTARCLVHELIDNLQYVDDIVYEEPTY